ncbi:inorganic phosphate transporter [Kytococcus sedentarius]|uniref:Phosphate transporter n=1 Tax=Kytococcus sedentarius (strain ATCC 14392 / DSM 20547 / JCM 11482 / CCUG 33030 / NBRC 15357 / NCTC 11040 / CCM 314 / 541) TaxID=478801 RepID=C7NIF3_KYTSD|nr:inorganic phosphate transporter [Kytococcus sedentarius]ACV05124.1 phosphate/sulfate permease [Kytococcus sedentarius DSM 20547]STX13472.1 Sulfate permease CysP [Kytococcus sedentarius]
MSDTTPAPSGSTAEQPTTATGSDRWWHLAFGLLLAATAVTFTLWAMGQIESTTHHVVLVVTIVFGLFMAFNIGGNDVANSFGTSVGAGTLSMKQALMVAAVFEVGGAVLAGGEVTDTVRSGIVDLDGLTLAPMDFAFIMMSALLGAALWLLIATQMGWPVSTTHSIIGGIVGAAVTLGLVTGTGGWEMVQWGEIGQIAISWVLSPVLGGLVAFLLFGWIKHGILVYNEEADARLRQIKRERIDLRTRHKAAFERLDELQQLSYTNAMARDAVVIADEDFDRDELESDYYRELYAIQDQTDDVAAHKALETWVPLLAAFGSVVITAMLLFKGLKNLHLNIDGVGNFLIMGMVGAAVWVAVFIFAKSLKRQTLSRSTFVLFSWMQVFTACAFAFSHGSNDIANAVGPFAAVFDVLRTEEIGDEAAVPGPLMLAAGVALVAGLWFIGRRVITTVGSGLTAMHPANGFAAELSAAGVVMIATLLGLPVSSTHILIGAVLGVGLVNKAANWKLMRPIALAWVITLPAAAGIGALTLVVLRAIFG